MDMIDELTLSVAAAAGLAPAQARTAVDSMLRYLAAQLPSPQFGELQARLRGPATGSVPAATPVEPRS